MKKEYEYNKALKMWRQANAFIQSGVSDDSNWRLETKRIFGDDSDASQLQHAHSVLAVLAHQQWWENAIEWRPDEGIGSDDALWTAYRQDAVVAEVWPYTKDDKVWWRWQSGGWRGNAGSVDEAKQRCEWAIHDQESEA